HHHRPPLPPADSSRMTSELGMREPDLVGQQRCLDMQRPCLQKLETSFVECPFNLDRLLQQRLALSQHSTEFSGLPWRQARCLRVIGRYRLRRNLAMLAAVTMILAARLNGSDKTLPVEHNAVRHHLALRDGGAETPGRADQHVA